MFQDSVSVIIILVQCLTVLYLFFSAASMDVCIFMRDRSGIHCTLEEGHNAEAEDLFDIVLQEQGFPPECEDVFALWLVSPLIGRSGPRL